MSFHTRLNEILEHCQLVNAPQGGFRKLIPWNHGYLLIEKSSDMSVVKRNIEAIYVDPAWRYVSLRWFTDRLLKFCAEKLFESKKFSKIDEDFLKSEVANMPNIEVTVIREVTGASFYKASPPVRIGKFIIYDWAQHSEIILQHCQHEFDASFMKENKHRILAECKVTAAESRKVSELATLAFQELESLITFIVGSRSFEFSLVNYAGPRESFTYTISSDSFGYSVDSPENFEVNLSAPVFQDPPPYIGKLISINEASANALERKICRSIDWTAQALREPNMGSAFIKAMIALESLLKIDEQGGFAPSIVAQISEATAQILGSSIEECIHIASDIKRLYGIRSSAVHSGSNDIKQDDLSKIINYTRQIIFTLLNEEKFQPLDSPKKLGQFLTEAKYSNTLGM
ncbi:hypothetical protein ACK3BK_23675 [Pseudomonas sp. L7]|uniref:hypothetical protein n=1 Tax=Pseudomonas sp. L7 TaxID=3388343 RepID=UPI0039853690